MADTIKGTAPIETGITLAAGLISDGRFRVIRDGNAVHVYIACMAAEAKSAGFTMCNIPDGLRPAYAVYNTAWTNNGDKAVEMEAAVDGRGVVCLQELPYQTWIWGTISWVIGK